MLQNSQTDQQRSLFFSLGDSLNQRHPVYILAGKVAWGMFG